MISVPVEFSDDRRYDVLIGAGAAGELASVISAIAPQARRVALVSQEGVAEGLRRQGVSIDPGREQRWFFVGDGEHHKRLSTIETLCDEWSLWGMTRNDLVVAVGGGMVTDVGGFAASVYYRGVQVIYVSTSLLGMIDAAIGGKTGVNLATGKNLVGSFWQPSAVLCDTNALGSMPPRERACGFGEMAKYQFLGVPDLSELTLEEQIARCVALKAKVVTADEREGGLRAILNYGHTLGHALEIAGDHDLRHGEAVAIGLIFAAHLAHVLGRIDAARVDEHRRLVQQFDLRAELPLNSDRKELIALMARDKKALSGLTFVLDGPNGVETVAGISESTVHAAFDSMEAAATPSFRDS